MLNSPTLDIIISLIFVYVTLSLICLTITEAVTRIFSSRKKVFEQTIGNVLANATGSDNAIKLFINRLQMLYGAEHREAKWLDKKNLKIKSFADIPNKTIAAVMLDVVNEYRSTAGKNNSVFTSIIGDLASSVKKGKTDVEETKEKLVTKIEEWVSPLMDKIAATYRRNTERFALIIATIVVIFNNADTISMTAKLKEDSFNREVIVKYADEQVKKIGNLTEKAEIEKAIAQDLSIIQQSGLPFGPESWTTEFDKIKKDPAANSTLTTGNAKKPMLILWLLSKISGLIATIALVSLGAPFWLNTLKRIVDLKNKAK
jgi:hypothetical protein